LSTNGFAEELSEVIVHHYHHHDPYKEVAVSKKAFFNSAINYLTSRTATNEKKILDIGCGFGYFLDHASKAGWKPYGVEVVEDAANVCRKKFKNENIFQMKLIEIGLAEKLFDAVTLWDVLPIVDNPYDELKECYRLLKSGGIIGIRTRNAAFQTMAYRLFNPIKKFAMQYGVNEPYVFNNYCFSGKSLYTLLSRLGYINIKIGNSPLTSGDPYNHMRFNYPVKLAKNCIDICSKLAFFITRGRLWIAPSILIWAQKP
jgi:SAM-dependent methyltransferase